MIANPILILLRKTYKNYTSLEVMMVSLDIVFHMKKSSLNFQTKILNNSMPMIANPIFILLRKTIQNYTSLVIILVPLDIVFHMKKSS